MVFRNGDAVRVARGSHYSNGLVVDADRTSPEPVYQIAVAVGANEAVNRNERITGIRVMEAETHHLKHL